MSSPQPTPQPRSGIVHGYDAVPLSALRAVRYASVDLYVQYDPQGAPALLCQARWALDKTRLKELEDVGVEKILVRNSDFNAFSDQLFHALDALLDQEELPAAEKFSLLQVAVAGEVNRTLRVIDASAYCRVANKISDDLIDLVSGGGVLPSDLFDLARHDYTTFAHVTNVAGYAALLTERLDQWDEQERRDIAYGAMLHDFGKRSIPIAVLNKPGRFTPAERELMETHPSRGYEELCRRTDLNFGQLMMVYQHHERMDGQGYPVGIVGDEIHPWARLLAVVDVFDAITAQRPYRQPMSIKEAVEYQLGHAGTHFDEGFLACWASIMTPAPAPSIGNPSN